MEGLFSPIHLVLLLVIALIIFGPGKLPELGSSFGKAIQGFKKAMNEPEKKTNNTPDDKSDKSIDNKSS
jgi:sec-independent protein translocase protein TatA